MNKIRIYDLAKELKLDSRRVIDDARRFGFDVSVPSNSLSDTQADRIRAKYFVKKTEPSQLQVRLVKKKVDAMEPSADQVSELIPAEFVAGTIPPEAAVPSHRLEGEDSGGFPAELEMDIAGPQVRITPLHLVQRPAIQQAARTQAGTPPPPEVADLPVQIEPPLMAQPRTQVRMLRPSGTLAPPPPAPAPMVPTVYVPPRDDRRRHRRRPMRPTTPRTGTTVVEQAPVMSPPTTPEVREIRQVKLMEGLTVKEFSEKLEVKPRDIVRLLMQQGVLATINQNLDSEVAKRVARELGFEVTFASFEEIHEEAEIEKLLASGEEEELAPRAPVVTVMGHVDHGKTSLLDAIRQTRVAESEAGGITQHIGAYVVQVPNPDRPSELRPVVFLDTPGHEAFTLMRARGAQVTDLVVLVVAADDGVMPQTIEAINHARSAGVPIIVAINKVDKPEANADRVRQALSDQGLVWDGWGGDTVMVEVSAKKRINLDRLLEMILLSADILDLKASPRRKATGIVLEAKLDRGRGPVASILVQQGTVSIGNPFVVGSTLGRVRAMFNDRGAPVMEAPPATPVEIIGLESVPQAGDRFSVVEDISTSQRISSTRQTQQRAARAHAVATTSLEQLYEKIRVGELKELQIVLKADVQGSLEALRGAIEKLSTEKVKVRIVLNAVGAITESDVLLAAASRTMERTAIVIGFNVRPEPRAEEVAKQEGVDIRLHSIIYKVEEEIRQSMLGLLEMSEKEVTIGRAEVRQVFRIAKAGNVAGCMVQDGTIKRTARVRLLRDNVVVHDGTLASLKRFKDDAGEVRQGFECGISLERYNDIKEGDIIEAYIIERVAQTL
ncbi:MAG: translation initiation factor IF-2 [Acidobacteria bacterium]|nr:translation initiation factor IF-2 [Acidobacteriota bacterium]